MKTGSKFFVIILILLATISILIGCSDDSDGGDKTAPTLVSDSIENNANIYTVQKFVLVYDEAIKEESIELTGDLGLYATAEISTTTVENDTITISPKAGEWTVIDDVTLIIDVKDAAGNSAEQISKTVSVLNTQFVAEGGGGDGSIGSPYGSVQAGIDVISEGFVLVSEGTYSVAGTVATIGDFGQNASLIGGFSDSDEKWFTRDAKTYTTTLTNTGGTDTVEFDCSSITIASSTILDGFTITGRDVEDSRAIYIHGGTCSPTIQNNIINGGSVTGLYNAFAIYLEDTSLSIIQNNTITSPNIVNGVGVAIHSISNTTHATVTSNTINFGSIIETGTIYLIVENSSGSDYASVQNNTFIGTPSATKAYYYDEGNTYVSDIDSTSITLVDGTSGTLASFGNTAE